MARDDPAATPETGPRRPRGAGVVPRSVLWAARAFGFVWIGALTIAAGVHAHDSSALAVQISGYALIGLALGGWAVADLRTPLDAPAGRWLAPLLAGVAVVSGFACMSHNGALLVVFACIATLVAGGDTALPAALCVTGAGILGVVAGAVAFGANVAELIGYPMTILACLLMGMHRRSFRVQAEQAAELLARTRQLQEQQRQVDVLDERARIAREIHDVLAHSLGALSIQIQAARAVLTDSGDVGKALEVLGTAQRMAADGLTETRRAVHALRSDTRPLDQELRDLAAAHGGRHGVRVDFEVTGTPRELPPAATMALLRVAQEALVNAAKHAAHQPVALVLAYAPDDVRLTTANPVGRDGTVGDPEPRTTDRGYGLTGMKERLLLIGGTLTAGRRGDTWTVAAELPYAPAAR